MEYKFKVGERVTAPDTYRKGQVGVIDFVDHDDLEYPYRVRFSIDPHDYDWFTEDELSLVIMHVSNDSVKWTSEQSKSKPITEGIKFDSDKLQWWYLWQFLPELEQVAYVLQYGDKKYPAEDGSNWKRLDNLERRASSAAMRHLSAYLQNDKQDNETNKSHLAHAITNLLFLMHKDRQNANST